MKKITTKAFLLILLIFSNILTFAQSDNPNDPPAGGDSIPAPIDSYSCLLVLIAIILSFYFLNKVYKKNKFKIN
jgi:hypothetical protein